MRRRLRVLILLAWAASCTASAQQAAVTGHVEFVESGKRHARRSSPAVVVWLTPVSGPNDATRAVVATDSHPQLVQRNKSFTPHLLVVPVGTAVEFPNRDPFFHNVFSLFDGKRFDLGLYEAGSARMVHFDRAGISYIFCNIHPEMSAVVIALDTRLYAISDLAGQVSIADVPYGRYVLHAWSEGALPDALQSITHEIRIGEQSASLGTIHLSQGKELASAHKNKYGRDYDHASPSNPIYPQP